MSGSSSASSTRPSRSSTSRSSPSKVVRRRLTRAYSAFVLAAVSGSSQNPGSPMRASKSEARVLSSAGSKVVREELELLADRREALRRRLGRGGGAHGCSVLDGLPGVPRRRATGGPVAQVPLDGYLRDLRPLQARRGAGRRRRRAVRGADDAPRSWD